MPSPKYMFEKPRQDVVPRPRQAPNQFCRKATYAGGKLTECHKPTDGHTYCPDCQNYLVTMLDRPANQPTKRARLHPWAEEGLQRAQRAKRSA